MERVRFGNTDITASRIALGTWAIGGTFWGGTEGQDAIKTIHQALDVGITTIDTAPVYGFGRSEEIIGEAIATSTIPRDQIVIATKAGREWDEHGNLRSNSRPSRIRHEIEESLRRLRTDYIDIYQVHHPDPDTPIEDTAMAMHELLEEGKVRAIGVSNYTVEQVARWCQVAPLHSHQFLYNMLERDAEVDLLPYCRQYGLAVFAYSPLARGLLTGKISDDTVFPPGDTRVADRRFRGNAFKHNLRLVDRLKELASGHGKTISQLAVRWVLDQPGVTIALWGARRPDHISEAAGITDWQMTKNDLHEIDALLTPRRAGVAGLSH